MADMYIKFGDKIKGESTDKEHKDWCEIQSFSHGAHQPTSGASGSGGRTAAGVQFGEFSISKFVDKASPDILQACCNGEHIPEIEMNAIMTTNKKRNVYLKYKLENVVVSNYTIMGNGNGEKPTEAISLNPGKITEIYTPVDHKGNKGKEVSRGWDIQDNTA